MTRSGLTAARSYAFNSGPRTVSNDAPERESRRAPATDGVRPDPRSWPIALGYVPVAVAFGVTGTVWHLPVWLILALSLTVYAGASQFAVVPLLAGGAGPAATVLTAWLINARMAVESASLAVHADWARKRPWILFWLTDEVFVTASLSGVPTSPPRFLALAWPPYVAWAAATLAGTWLGALLPRVADRALGFSLYGLYLALIVGAVRQERKTATAALFGGLASWAAHAAGLGSWSLVAGSVLGGGAYWWATRPRPEDPS
jgi:predicted branched-subunit amino acid permease